MTDGISNLISPVRVVASLLYVVSLLSAGDAGAVVTLSATYDFDGDGLSEFLSLEKRDTADRLASSAVYYEIDEMGSHIELWRFTSVSRVIDADLSDLDGDGNPEIIVTTKTGVLGAKNGGVAWLHLFTWTGVDFSPDPEISWSGSEDMGVHRPSNISVIDLNNDGRDEVAVALNSPERGIILLSLNSDGGTDSFADAKLLTTGTLSSGFGQIYVSTVDHNGDGFPDLMAISQEFSSMKVQIFENEGGDLVEGPSFKEDISLASTDQPGLIGGGITALDIDEDGNEEVLLPLRSGETLALSVREGELAVTSIEPETAALFRFDELELSPKVINDILLERAERGILGMKIKELKLEATDASSGTMPEEVSPTSPRGKVQKVRLTSVDAEDGLPAPEAADTQAENQQEAADEAPPDESGPPSQRMQQVQLTAVKTVPGLSAEEGGASSESASVKPEESPIVEGEVITEAATGRARIKKMELTSMEKEDVSGDVVAGAGKEEVKISPEAVKEETADLRSRGRVKKLELTSLAPSDVTETTVIDVPPDVTVSDTLFVGQLFTHSLETGGRTMQAFKPEEVPPGATFDDKKRAVVWTPGVGDIGLHRLAYQIEYALQGKRPSIEERRGTGVQVVTQTESESVELFFIVLRPR